MEDFKRQPLAPAEELGGYLDVCSNSCVGSSPAASVQEEWGDPIGSFVLHPEKSLIPPVPRVVEAFVRSGSRIPRPEYSPMGSVMGDGRRISEDCVFSPKGMDPCRFASIRHKFEAMQVHAAKACAANKALKHSQSEPVQRVQRIAESLARLEQEFPQVGMGLLTRSQTAQVREDEEAQITVLREYLTDIGMSASPDLYDESNCEELEEGFSKKRRSAGVHMSVSSFNHPEDVSVESEQTAQSLDTGTSHVSFKKKPLQSIPTTQAAHKEAESFDQGEFMTEESDAVMMHLREEVSCLRSGPNHSDFVEDSAGRGLQSSIPRNVKKSCNKSETQHKVIPISEDCKGRNPCRFSPRDQMNSPDSIAEVDRSTTPCSLACVSETRASYRRSLSRVSGSLTGGSFDSMWSLEVSESCGVRAHCNEAQTGPYGQVYSPKSSSLQKNQNTRTLSSPTESLEVSYDARERTQCLKPVSGSVTAPGHVPLDLLAAPDNQAKDLSERRVLYWGSLNEQGILHCSAVEHTLDTLLEERSAQTYESDANTNFTRSLVIESQTSSGVGYNSPKHTDKGFSASLDISCTKDLHPKHMTQHRWSVAALEELSLGIPSCCPQYPQTAREHDSSARCRRSKTQGLAKYGFTFDLPEVMTSGDIPLDGGLVKLSSQKDGDETSNMEDSESTVICSTPRTSRLMQTKWCPSFLGRVVTAMKSFVPRSGVNKKSVASEPAYHDCFGVVDPESPVAGRCLPVRMRKRGSEEKRHPTKSVTRTYSANLGGTKKWWKSHCKKEQQVAAGCGRLGSQTDAKLPESSVHKYSRRHMFIMDKIENERLGKTIHPKRRVGQERDLGWEAVKTT